MHKLVRTLLIFIIATHSTIVCAAEEYTLEDLKVLSTNGQYEEFFSHVLDIRPSKRDSTWNELVISNSIGYFDQISNFPITKSTLEKLKNIIELPPLKSNEMVNSRKNAVLSLYAKNCLSINSFESCLTQIKPFLKSSPIDYEFNYKIFSSFNKKATLDKEKKSLASLASILTKSKFSEFYCNKEDLSQYVFSYINSEDILSMHSDCQKELVTSLRKLTSYNLLSDTHIKFLTKYKATTNEDKAFYEFLTTIRNDNLHNLNANKALANLEELKSNASLRKSVLDKIKAVALIPDNIFSKSSNKEKFRAQAIKRKISRSFPEFINLYTKTCLDYLKGTKEYAAGSPTVNCHDFFSEAKELNLVDGYVINEYKKVTNI